ncbi:MAG: hypothetical protein ABI723_19505 [Bacteroidia bacterium]
MMQNLNSCILQEIASEASQPRNDDKPDVPSLRGTKQSVDG